VTDPWEKLYHKLFDAKAAPLKERRKLLIDAQELLMELFLETASRVKEETPKIDLNRVQQALAPVLQTMYTKIIFLNTP
jgi:hypothetical protein